MKFVWDEPKRLANLEKHGLDFEDVVEFSWETAVIDVGHTGRMKAVGYLGDRAAVVIFSVLGEEATAIISFRPAGNRERRLLR